MIIYLLHFAQPIGTARHYLGSTTEQQFAKRIQRHRSGTGAALTRTAFNQHITFEVARTWSTSDRQLERDLKATKQLRRLCPLCIDPPPLTEPRKSDPQETDKEKRQRWKPLAFASQSSR